LPGPTTPPTSRPVSPTWPSSGCPPLPGERKPLGRRPWLPGGSQTSAASGAFVARTHPDVRQRRVGTGSSAVSASLGRGLRGQRAHKPVCVGARSGAEHD
jgi:hypothetical protein